MGCADRSAGRLFLLLIALLFVGPGQEIGRRFAAIDNRLTAYTVDILGSMAGIAAFGLMSLWGVRPFIWFLVALTIGVYFVPRRRLTFGLGALTAVALVGLADWPFDAKGLPAEVSWSPYYQVRFKPRSLLIDVNKLAHQGMVRIDREGPAYLLPHWLSATAGGRPFEDVMIVGAGSGNDVSAALACGARHVDAVEIDPVLYSLGKEHHPNRPYDDERVAIHIDDGRSFVRKTRSRYDLISYALVDSLVLHSSYSSVRLESFLFTEQAFRDVKEKLKPGGVFVMYNFYRQGWVVARLARLAHEVFGSRPIVFTLPYQPKILPGENQGGTYTFFMVGNGQSPTVEAIRSRFEREKFFWITAGSDGPQATTSFGPGRPKGEGGRAAPVSRSVPRTSCCPTSIRCRPTTGRFFTCASR